MVKPLVDIAAALEAMPEEGGGVELHPTKDELVARVKLLNDRLEMVAKDALDAKEEVKRWRDGCGRIIEHARSKEQNSIDNEAKFNEAQILRCEASSLYREATGTPWTPPQPERVTDEELEEARNHYFNLSEPGMRGSPKETVKRLIEAERERRRGEGK
jgi:hypothetical protein